MLSVQVIRMNNERFAIPELLFHPSDIGIHEMGVAEAIVNSVSSSARGWFRSVEYLFYF